MNLSSYVVSVRHESANDIERYLLDSHKVCLTASIPNYDHHPPIQRQYKIVYYYYVQIEMQGIDDLQLTSARKKAQAKQYGVVLVG
jgi:hypothetical protein